MKGKFAWKFFKQPGAVEEYTKEDLPENPEANGFVMAANKWWLTNPNTENKKNLPNGYYEQTLLGKNLDWIRCYAQGLYTYVQEGKPVISEYDDNIMATDFIEPDISLPIQVGVDFGLTPSSYIRSKIKKW